MERKNTKLSWTRSMVIAPTLEKFLGLIQRGNPNAINIFLNFFEFLKFANTSPDLYKTGHVKLEEPPRHFETTEYIFFYYL